MSSRQGASTCLTQNDKHACFFSDEKGSFERTGFKTSRRNKFYVCLELRIQKLRTDSQLEPNRAKSKEILSKRNSYSPTFFLATIPLIKDQPFLENFHFHLCCIRWGFLAFDTTFVAANLVSPVASLGFLLLFLHYGVIIWLITWSINHLLGCKLWSSAAVLVLCCCCYNWGSLYGK